MAVKDIHNSLLMGEESSMVSQIQEYGVKDFWIDYTNFLGSTYSPLGAYKRLSEVILIYFNNENK